MKKIVSLLLVVACTLALAACGGSTGVTPNMTEVYTSMQGSLPEMEPFSDEAVLNAYGVKREDCKQMVISSYYDGAVTAEIWLVEAVSEEALQTVKALAESRLTGMGEQFRTYDAKAYDLVQKGKLIVHGNCLAMIVAEDVDALASIYNTAAKLN